MKKIYLYSLLTAMLMLLGLNGCAPDTYSLGDKNITSDDLAYGTAFVIEYDESNPNIVTLRSLISDSYQVCWNHPQGRSQGPTCTLNIAFPGTYSVQMGVETRGGVVYGDIYYFDIANFCADFVSNDLWTYISGGVGKSKKWYLDLDENGVSRYFSGPLYFYGLDDCWESVALGQTIDGDSWSWGADWGSVAGWGFTSTAQDFGYMEFDLVDGANVHTVQNDLGRDQTGTYMLDTDNHTIKFTDAELLHESVYDGAVDAWTGEMKILSLTENTMQIAVVRNSDPCLLCYNFISEDYYNNWTEETVEEDVVPTLADDWRDYVEPKTQNIMTYKLSDENPFDWCNLDGTLKNITSYAAVEGVEDLTFTMNHKENTYSITTPDGTAYSGTYSLSDDGIFTFSDALPTVQLSQANNALFKSNSDNTLRVMQYETDAVTGGLTDLWLGSEERDDQGNLYQYLGYHFVLQTGGATVKSYKSVLSFFDTGWGFQHSDNVGITGDGSYTFTINGSSSAPYGLFLDVYKVLTDNPNFNMTVTDIKVDGNSIDFDDTIIDRGVGDESHIARRYILNPWGATAGEASKFVFTSSLQVTIKVEMDCGEVVMKKSK